MFLFPPPFLEELDFIQGMHKAGMPHCLDLRPWDGFGFISCWSVSRVCVCMCASTYAGKHWHSQGSPGLFGGKYSPGNKKEGSIHAQAHSGVNIFCKWKFVFHIVRGELLFTHRGSDSTVARGWEIQRWSLINSADQKWNSEEFSFKKKKKKKPLIYFFFLH